ncbi:MAG: phosphotransferase [Bacteroidales bacterium]|jgi:aminoglycoside/choline kinase family phosphotransferase
MIEIDQQIRAEFARLFQEWSGEKAQTISALPESGSYRLYARINGASRHAVAVFYSDLKENLAFLGFARHFRKAGIPVPEIYCCSPDSLCYLQEDFGDHDLFEFLQQSDMMPDPAMRMKILGEVVEWLPKIQIEGNVGLNYDLAYPRKSFDKQSMLWDLNYFKYNFLKLVRIPFDEQALEDDFHTFTAFLSEAPQNAFLYRDFQSRNIMIHNDHPCFIDFQGGRMGFPGYDLASLLFDAKAGLSPEERDTLYQAFLRRMGQYDKNWPALMQKYYPGFVLIRKMQALGAFGFRGLIEQKKAFLQSIPPAMINLDWVTSNFSLECNIPELWKVLSELPHYKGMKRIIADILKHPEEK